MTVNCWGRLAIGVVSSLSKGDAVVVVGTVHTSEYEDREGTRRSSLEMRATAVGPDLSRYIATIKKVEEMSAPDSAEAKTPDDDDADTVAEHVEGSDPLLLTA